jgi:hypothetical protein
MRARFLAPVLLLATALAVPASAADHAKAAKAAERFEGSSILVEHSGSIGHQADLSPSATAIFQQTVALNLAFAAHEVLDVEVYLAMVRELTATDTTYPHELLVDDLLLEASVTLPGVEGEDGSFDWGFGLGVALPTSKASRAASLQAELQPSFGAALTADLLGGLTLSYGITPTPRFHRFTTISTVEAIPCSPATGCALGRSFETGQRNTQFELVQDIDLSLSALDDRLSFAVALQVAHGWLYELSPSERFAEEQITNPGNDGGSPVTLTTAFTLEVGVQPHPAIGLGVGIWTPGGMRPDGTYYNPVGNRFTQVYFDVTLYPVDGILAQRQRALKAASSSIATN